jgi:hypothetical protein
MERYVQAREVVLTVVDDPSYTEHPVKAKVNLSYSITLDPGKAVLTPLDAPAFVVNNKEESKQRLGFVIVNKADPVDRVTMRVLKGSQVYADLGDVADLRVDGQHLWFWDGQDNNGVLDTKVLKEALTLELTAVRRGESQIFTFNFKGKTDVVPWVDVRADRSKGGVDVQVRPGYSDGGVSSPNAEIPSVGYSQLLTWATEGLSYYWTRDGSRAGGIAAPIKLAGTSYKVVVQVLANVEPCAPVFRLIEDQDDDFGRSTSLAAVRKVVYSSGYYYSLYVKGAHQTMAAGLGRAIGNFKETAAHEFGHLILNAYEGDPLVPTRSWSHKGTSTVLTQSPVEGHPSPKTGEIDVMHYFSENSTPAEEMRTRTCAAEDDVKGLLWIARVRFASA